MKGYIPVDIPTKKYIKAYIIHEFKNKPYLNRTSVIGSKLEDLLCFSTNERRTEFSTRYNSVLRVYISMHVFKNRGGYLNHTNIKYFNLFVEDLIKKRFYEIMDDAVEVFPSFEANIGAVRRKLGITEDDWSTDSMKKDYYRYRIKTGKELFYKKNFPLSVPSMPLHQYPFSFAK